MDPRVSWFQPELLTKAYSVWSDAWIESQREVVQQKVLINRQNGPPQQPVALDEDELLLDYLRDRNRMRKQTREKQLYYPDRFTRAVVRNRASTFGHNLPDLHHQIQFSHAGPWLCSFYTYKDHNDGIHLIDEVNCFRYDINPAKYLLNLDPDAPVVELDKGFLRYCCVFLFILEYLKAPPLLILRN